MDIQFGTASPPAAAPVAARAAPLPGANGPRKTAAPQPPLSRGDLEQAAGQINHYLKSSSSNLQFMVDGDSSKVLVRIVDSQTKEVIRQIPSEEMVAISKSLDHMSGLLIKQKT